MDVARLAQCLRRVSLCQLSDFLLDLHQPLAPKGFGLLLNSE
jgi:hypothetical protein